MTIAHLALTGAIVFFAANVFAYEDNRGCDHVLVQDVITSYDSSDSRKHAVSLVNEEHFERMGKSADASVQYQKKQLLETIGLGANATWGEFSEKRKLYLKFDNTQEKLAISRSSLVRTMPSAATQAWLTCMTSGNNGLHIWISENEGVDQYVTVNVSLVGAQGDIRTVRVEARGAKKGYDRSLVVQAGGKRQFLLDRIKDQPIQVIVGDTTGAVSDIAISPVVTSAEWGRRAMEAIQLGSVERFLAAYPFLKSSGRLPNGEPFLVVAADTPRVEVLPIIQFLIAAGSDVNVTGQAGVSPIYAAANSCNVPVFKALVAGNAKVDIPLKSATNPNWIAMDIATYNFEQKGNANCEPIVRNIADSMNITCSAYSPKWLKPAHPARPKYC